jgi:Na+:H+ antiporter, NhaA family
MDPTPPSSPAVTHIEAVDVPGPAYALGDGERPTHPNDRASAVPAHAAATNRLDRPVDAVLDHLLGPSDAPITLVEYGSYACPYCRAANERITEVRGQLGERLRYVFRHRPLIGSELARPAAELAECAADHAQFWDVHVTLMTRSATLTEGDLQAVAGQLGIPRLEAEQAGEIRAQARRRVERDIESAHASGVHYTPTFFINGRRYDGPWDESSFADAMLGTLGHRVRTAALTFAAWAPSAGVLLLVASLVALALTNSPLGPTFQAFWHTELAVAFGDASFRLPLVEWVNEALLTVFFLVVGLEIKREITVGHLASRKAAALPIAASIGGMAAPALLYLAIVPSGAWTTGWGVPMSTDTAFAVALIAMLGARVPVELRIFLTAAAIVDDIGSIIVVAVFYSGNLHWAYLAAGAAITAGLGLLNRSGVYRVSPYILAGGALWACIFAGGLHGTLAGVILAALIPTRPPPDLKTLAVQADTILAAEAERGREQLHRGPSTPALVALDAIFARLESPADRLLRTAAPRSSYLVLPVFALANAGVAVTPEVLNEHALLVLAILAGLVVGKPLGVVLACALAVWLRLASKPTAYSWRQVLGAGALAGIGFTMSLFIAGQAFPAAGDFAAAKVAVLAASLLSSLLGIAILWKTSGNAAS